MTSLQDLLHPAVAAYHDLVARVLPQARSQCEWQPDDGRLPSLFVSHGAPPTLNDPSGCRTSSTGRRRCPSRAASSSSAPTGRTLVLGERLRALRDERVLVSGSGYMTHSF